MPLYTDPGYSYYSSSSGGSLYSPYYSAPSYGSSLSNSYAPYASAYNRSYVPPPPPRSTQYSALVSRYQPKLSTITESPLTSRANFIPLTRIQSPKISTYSPTLASKYIAIRKARPRTINTADIDVSASSRYGRHHHMADRKKDEEKAEAEAEAAADSQSTSNVDSDASSGIIDPNSPYMPRVDGTDTSHHARSTIKRNRAVVRLSMMRPRSRGEPKADNSSTTDKTEPQDAAPSESNQSDQLEKFHIHDKAREEGIQVTVTDMTQAQNSETSLNELIIEVDPITHTVRRLSIPQVPSFHDICEDISSDKIDDDLNAGELRRRASLIQEQEMEIINELQKSQSGSFQVIHLDPNVCQDDGRKSRKSKKTKKIRHKITANVAIENSSPSYEDSTASPTVLPKFTFNIEDIEEHKIFKLPKKRTTSVKSKKSDESSKAQQTDKAAIKPGPPDKKTSKAEEPQVKVATPKPIVKIEKSESSEDFWSQIGTRETLYMNKRKKSQEKTDDDEIKQKTLSTPSDAEAPTSPLKLKSKPQDKTPEALTETSKKDDQQPASPKKLVNKPPILENIQIAEPLKKDEQKPSTPKKLTSKSQESPKTKNAPKLVAKKKSSPKNDAKEETATPSLKLKTKPTVLPQSPTTTNKESIASPKINIGSGPKSPEKKKTSTNADTTAIKQSITKNAVQDEVVAAKPTNDKKIPEISTKTTPPWMIELKSTKQEQQKSLTPPTTPIKSAETSAEISNFTTKKTSSKSTAVTCDTTTKKLTSSPTKSDDTSPLQKLKPAASSLKKQQSPIVASSPPPTTPTTTAADVSTAQVMTPKSTSTTATPTATTASPSSSTSSTKTARTSLGNSGNNNLSKFSTISNLAQCLQDVDADLEDYIPSSAEETDSSSDSYIEDGSLSASMKKKNKQLRKKAKQEQQGFDPNKKIKIDTKKKCYVKEEAPRYPLIATPRPLWKREKVVYEESSNSSSEETESDSECTTSDEYEDELSPKDAIIRMSTSSNDSGFDGGTATSSSKKALDCDVNCHKKCEKLTANLCGVKQKLIVEALACVKRGTQEARDSPCSPLSLNPAYKIEANDDETSYTYLQFQKSGRITAPATSIPRFKKYSVEDFHFLAVLGKGSFGKVLLAELRNTDFYYAVKCLKKDVVLEDDDVECTLIERKVLALGTKHPYLCHLFCTFQTESHLFFVMEYLNGGDLMFHIQESGRFPEDRAQFYGAEIISGLKFLHKKGIIYRDLKLDNVLLDFDGHVRIADFGMCKLQIYLDKTADSFCGTPDYMAPEIIKGDKYNQNVDWWSFGVLLYEMLIGQSPFSGCDEDELFWSICNEIPWFPVYITKEATSILKGLLEKDYTRRVGSQYSPAGDICDHIFFKSIDWGLLEKRQLPPPFKPQVKHPLDTQYFDRAFTRERVRLTPIDKEILQSMDQEQFQGFSYTNPNATLD